MNYYEQLGLSANASAEEIKEAYRSLVRLLHPDHHPDPQLQKVAERQVQKLNTVYATLSDPDRRRQYDRDLAETLDRAKPVFIHAPPPRREGFLNKSSAAWITAVGVFVLLLIWMASRPVQVDPAFVRDSGASMVENPPVKSAPFAHLPEAAEAQRAVAPPAVQRATAAPAPAPADTSRQSAAEAEALRLRLVKTMGERDLALSEVNRLQSRAAFQTQAMQKQAMQKEALQKQAMEREAMEREAIDKAKRASALARLSDQKAPPAVFKPPQPKTQTTAVARVNVPPPPPDIPLVMRHPMSGFWVYRKPNEASKNKDLFPPEFIETNITGENGQVRGTYRARYRAPNRPVSPDVNFQFSGRLSGESGSLPWNGTGGAHGEVTLKLMADHSLRVDWTASQLGNLAFYRGTAVLVRRSD